MAITETYFDPDLATGLNDGTSEANAWQTWASMESGRVVGDRVNAKNPASPLSPGADIALALSATDLLVSIFRGYGVTIGDGTKFMISLGAFTLNVTGEGMLVQNIDVVGTDTTHTINMLGDASTIENFSAVNTNTGTGTQHALTMLDTGIATNGYIENNSTSAAAGAGSAASIEKAVLTNSIIVSTKIGVRCEVDGQTIVTDCLIYEKGTSGAAGLFLNNATLGLGVTGCCKGLTINGFTSAVHLDDVDDIGTAKGDMIVQDSILANADNGIFNVDSATKNMTLFFSSIAFYNCTTDTTIGDKEVIDKISLTADPFTNAAGLDFSLNNTAGGGADCRDVRKFGGA